jgi:Protein of unknown function DUF262/Protein of unknown function (DUF1524)
MPSKTIKSMIADINNEDADGGGLWLPNIQRLFVWDEEQIERLFDSIMREYPLPSMMIWKTKSELRNRNFIREYYENTDLKTLYRTITKRTKRLVLDGQQRLQALYLGLKGSYQGRTLHLNVLSGVPLAPDDIRYRFSFIELGKAAWPLVPLSKIIYSNKLAGQIAKEVIAAAGQQVSETDSDSATRVIERAKREIEVSETLLFQEIDGTDEDSHFEFEDIVEIFIRANSGGTQLSQSDLMFTLLTSDWNVADIEMQELLSELNGDGQFEFSRDFVLKSALAVLGLGARYEVEKLRDEKLRKRISDNWDKLSKSIKFVRDTLVSKTFIRSGQALTSYNALIPIIYFHFHFPGELDNVRPIRDYLLRVLLIGSFSGRPDGLIDKIVADINKRKAFDRKSIFRVIEEDGRSLKMADDLYWMGYGSNYIHTLFNLWYEFDYRPAFDGHLPQVDHIFPQSLLKSAKKENSETGRRVRLYSAAQINQLANCMLLTAKENGAGGKGDTPPDKWFADKDESYLELHCIPRDKKLWRLDNFEKFAEARHQMIREKFADLLLDEES